MPVKKMTGFTPLGRKGKWIQVWWRLLWEGAELEKKDSDGDTLLSLASMGGHYYAVKLLLLKGADIECKNDDGHSPLWTTSWNGHESVVRLLLDRGAMIESKSDDGRSPLWAASHNGHERVVRLLLDRGAMIESKSDDERSPLWIASHNGHESVVRLLLDRGAMIESKSGDGCFPLQAASGNGHEMVVKLLLDRGAMIENKSTDECSSLWAASWNGHESVVRLLLDRKAIIESKSYNGQSPLWTASQNGHESVVGLLLDRGAMVEAKDVEGMSPLNTASDHGQKKVVETLLQHKANIENTDNKGKSPLNQAATVGHIEVVEVLLKHGADIESKDNAGFSPKDNCVINGQVNVVRYFLKLIPDKADLRKTIEEWLLLAARHGKKDIISFLVHENKTLSLDFVGEKGQSPLATAISHSQFECVRMLHSWGATLSFIDDVKLVECLSQCGSTDIYKYLLIAGLSQPSMDSKSSHQKSPNYLAFSEDVDWDIIRRALSPHEVKGRERISPSNLVTFPGLGSVYSLDNYKLNDLKQTIDIKMKETLFNRKGIVQPTGGVAESTKVGLPDEFDYFIESKNQIHPDLLTDVGHGYRRYDMNDLPHSSKNVHSAVWAYMDYSDDMIISTPSAVTGGGSASTVIQMRWKDDEQRSLVVSIDVVPVIQVKGWPDDAIKKTWKMGYKDLKEWCYQLVVRPPHQDSTFGKTFEEAERERLYCVTFSKLEVEHIRDLPDGVKNAYILAKCLRDPAVCQVIVKDDGIFHFVDKFLTSYLLKTIFMHNMEDFLHNERPLVEMAYILYSQLEYYLSHGSIPVFWMPKINLLQGVNISAAKSHKVAAHMKAFVGGLYQEELKREPPGDVNANLGKPPACLDVDPNEAEGLEILSLPLKQ